jgi:ADP-heptose:LPS heptosyltransferase
MNKYLIIRFSSFGDIAQALPSAAVIKLKDPSAEIHWLTRHDFVNFTESYTEITKVWGLNRKNGILGLLRLSNSLKDTQYTHIYDAHSNLRSLIVSCILRFRIQPPKFIRRPKQRVKRALLFWFRINHFPKPFKGIDSRVP